MQLVYTGKVTKEGRCYNIIYIIIHDTNYTVLFPLGFSVKSNRVSVCQTTENTTKHFNIPFYIMDNIPES